VREATVTPHVGHPDLPVDVQAIAERTRALQQAIDAAGIDLRLALADGALLQVNACSLLGRNGSEAHGIPAEPGHRRAWRSLHEHRMRAAIVAARELGPPGR